MQRRAGDGAEVIVLDQQRAGELARIVAQLARAVGVERGAGRVLPARGEITAATAPRASARAQRGGEHPALVERDRLEHEALRAQQVVEGGVAGVLDGDAVARAQVRGEDPLDRRRARR